MHPNRRFVLLIILTLVSLLLLSVFLLTRYARMHTNLNQNQEAIPFGFDQAVLGFPEDLLGRWVRTGTQGRSFDWRQFSDTGDCSVRYDDVVYEGVYRIFDNRTIETTYSIYGRQDKTDRWTAGILDGDLIMVHQEWGWIERYAKSNE